MKIIKQPNALRNPFAFSELENPNQNNPDTRNGKLSSVKNTSTAANTNSIQHPLFSRNTKQDDPVNQQDLLLAYANARGTPCVPTSLDELVDVPEFAQDAYTRLKRLDSEYLSSHADQIGISLQLEELTPIAQFFSSLSESALNNIILELLLKVYIQLANLLQADKKECAIKQLPLQQAFIQTHLLNLKGTSTFSFLIEHLTQTEQQLRLLSRLENVKLGREELTGYVAALLSQENLKAEVIYRAFLLCTQYLKIRRCDKLFVGTHEVAPLFTGKQLSCMLAHSHTIPEYIAVFDIYRNLTSFVKNKSSASYIVLNAVFLSIITHPKLDQTQLDILLSEIFTKDQLIFILETSCNHSPAIHQLHVAFYLYLFKHLFPIEKESVFFKKTCEALSGCLKETVHSTDSTLPNPLLDAIQLIDQKLAHYPDRKNRMTSFFEGILATLPKGEEQQYLEVFLKQCAFNLNISTLAQYILLTLWAKHAQGCSHEVYEAFFTHLKKISIRGGDWVTLVTHLIPHLGNQTDLLSSALYFVDKTDDGLRKILALTALSKQVEDVSLLEDIYNRSLKVLATHRFSRNATTFSNVQDLRNALIPTIENLVLASDNDLECLALLEMRNQIKALFTDSTYLAHLNYIPTNSDF